MPMHTGSFVPLWKHCPVLKFQNLGLDPCTYCVIHCAGVMVMPIFLLPARVCEVPEEAWIF